ncbi:MAG: DUF6874 family protein [Gemmatimonadaceae bacterium]
MTVAPREAALIKTIAAKAVECWYEDWSADHKKVMRVEVAMDLTCVHANACPLELQGMLDGREFDLMHDVAGIRRHLNRRTGRLEGHFLPRYAKRGAR